ncbi:hypothetical protein Cgig2_033105 [Carnegiea gigantea]|uniref:Uncharacterized protein n=1 Tax=Carnegiea gigantea TaxID=171969 RepID=A0A9Q1K164_9CARY|nr:hypothetical protein Cgig2_033105 [Carnegiea gigantea]
MAALLEENEHIFQRNHNNNIKGLGLLPRSCDACRAAAALLYCRAHAAFFCGGCDCAVAGNRHERVWICDVCEQTPAVVTCKADAAALCAACDADIHSANRLAHRHHRLPVVPFVESFAYAVARPSVAFVDPSVAEEDDDHDSWLIQSPSSGVFMADFLCCDSDLLDFGFNSESNNLEKGNLQFCADVSRSFENCFDIDFSQPDKHHNLHSNGQLFSSFNYSASHSASSSEIGVVPDGNGTSMSEVSYTFTKSPTTPGTGDVVDGGSSEADGAPAMDRKARVLRYREKRKNRKFQKTIRYASRKAYAETRPRIKGRFTKRSESNETSEIDQIHGFGPGSNGSLIDHGGGYDVVRRMLESQWEYAPSGLMEPMRVRGVFGKQF